MKEKVKSIDKEKLFKILKWIFISFISFIVVNEFRKIFFDFNRSIFIKYSSMLTVGKLIIIAILGVVSYSPLSFYDFVLKERANISLDNNKLYRYSWIASSVSSIVGMGGTSAIVLKSYFYEKYTENKTLLIKEISRIIALNFTGFSAVCFIYTVMNLSMVFSFDLINILILLVSFYVPALICWMAYQYHKDLDIDKLKSSFRIMFISILEWITTIIHIFALGIILGVNVTLIQLFKVFVMSVCAGIISMTPGGVGSFDLSLILGLSVLGVDKELVLLMVFLYRASYYILPVIIGGILLVYDFYEEKNFTYKKIIEKFYSKISQIFLVILMFLTGLSLIFSGFAAKYIDKVILIKRIIPYNLMFISNSVSLGIGFVLIGLMPMMVEKYNGAYKVTLILSIVEVIISIFKFVCLKQIVFLLLFIFVLFLSRKQFYRKNFVLTKENTLLIVGMVLFLWIIHIGIFLKKIEFHSIFGSEYLLILRFLYTGIIMFISVSFIFVIPKLFCAKGNFPLKTLDMCINDVKYILEVYGGNSLSQYVFLRDKYVYLNEKKDAFLQYRISGNSVIVLGSPAGNRNCFREIIDEFYCLCDLYNYIPSFIGIKEDFIPILHDMGYHFIKAGEEANVLLDSFTLQGRNMKSIRNALCRVEKNGCIFEVIYPPYDNVTIGKLKTISDEWLSERKEKGFFMGFFDKDYLELNPIAVVKNNKKDIIGFASLMNMYDNNSISIDLMRFKNGEVNGIMDFLFVNLFLWAKKQGYKEFNMGMAPLANVGCYECSFRKERFARLIFNYGNKYYSFNGLKRYKEKYAKIWRGEYIAYRNNYSLIRSIYILTSKGISNIVENSDNSVSVENKYTFLKSII